MPIALKYSPDKNLRKHRAYQDAMNAVTRGNNEQHYQELLETS